MLMKWKFAILSQSNNVNLLLHPRIIIGQAFSLDNLKLDDDVLNIPLFMAEADRLIGLALEQQRSKL